MLLVISNRSLKGSDLNFRLIGLSDDLLLEVVILDIPLLGPLVIIISESEISEGLINSLVNSYFQGLFFSFNPI